MDANFLTILSFWFYDLYKDIRVSKLWVSVCMRRDSVGRPLPHSVLSYSNVFMSIALRCVLGCVWPPQVSQRWWSEGASGHGWATHLKIYFLWYVLHFKSVIKCTLIIIYYNPQGRSVAWGEVWWNCPHDMGRLVPTAAQCFWADKMSLSSINSL